jgi:formylglycine-generating enzyme required for sulfatase activity
MDHPVVQVSWNDARAYCEWAGVRLSTEAEWEKAAGWDPRAGRKRRYPWGDEWDEDKCHINCPDEGTAPVDAHSLEGDSAYGCGDMGGNVFEWCSTRWGTSADHPDYEYPYDLTDDREDLARGRDMLRIMRGASWHTVVELVEQWARCACRFRDYPRIRGNTWGLRVSAPRRLLSSGSES